MDFHQINFFQIFIWREIFWWILGSLSKNNQVKKGEMAALSQYNEGDNFY